MACLARVTGRDCVVYINPHSVIQVKAPECCVGSIIIFNDGTDMYCREQPRQVAEILGDLS